MERILPESGRPYRDERMKSLIDELEHLVPEIGRFYGMIFRLRPPESLNGQIYIECRSSLHSYKPDQGPLEPWVRGVAYHTVLGELNKSRRSRVVGDLADLPDSDLEMIEFLMEDDPITLRDDLENDLGRWLEDQRPRWIGRRDHAESDARIAMELQDPMDVEESLKRAALYDTLASTPTTQLLDLWRMTIEGTGCNDAAKLRGVQADTIHKSISRIRQSANENFERKLQKAGRSGGVSRN